jgi:hypothetical protein
MQITSADVWISSIPHLNQFSEIAKNNFGLTSFFKKRSIPPGFPYMRMFLSKLPLVLFTTGKLVLTKDKIEYNPARTAALFKYKNLDTDFKFDLPYDKLSVDWFTHPSPFMKSFNISWVKISCTNNHPFEHVLVSNTGTGFTMSQLNKNNNALFEALGEEINKRK